MTHKRFALTALLMALTLVIVPACGDDEPTKPDENGKPAVGEPGTPGDQGDQGAKAPEAPKPAPWSFNADSLKGYLAAFKDLKENAPRVLKDAATNVVTMAQSNDGLTIGNKATAILEKHGLTPEEFKKFGNKLWPAVVAVAPEKGAEAAGGLAALAGEHADTVKGVTDAALKDITKDVTEEDKALVKEHLDDILGVLIK